MITKKVIATVFSLVLFVTYASANGADEYGRTTMWWAAESNDISTMETLYNKDKTLVGTPDNLGATPLHVAACDGNKEAVEFLLNHGANPNAPDHEGRTPLHEAARGELWLYPSKLPEYHRINPDKLQDYKDVITLLLKHGALNANAGQTPSQLARTQQKTFYPELTEYTLADHIESLEATQH